MTTTSAKANKSIKILKDELERLKREEREAMVYSYSIDEEPVIIPYDYKEMEEMQRSIINKIAKFKHAINMYNTTYVLPGVDTTIDVALYRLAVMNERKDTLRHMCDIPAKSRKQGYNSGAEYTERNFDIAEVKAEYNRLVEEIGFIQMELDKANLTVDIHVDLESE